MKYFSPYRKYKIQGETIYSSIGPGGREEKYQTLESLNECRIAEIQDIFIPRHKLKPYQKPVMESILSGNNTFAILPTGSGKSLCFQAPSVFFPGITLVITPLVALIEDQVDSFNKKHIIFRCPAGQNNNEASGSGNICFQAIYPGMDEQSIYEMFSKIQGGQIDSERGYEIQYKLLYLSPERLCSRKFLRELDKAEDKGLRINHIVIDEVHCMSQWGFHFRESYLHIAKFIGQRPVRPMISAFTATATPKDITEIKNLLTLPNGKKFNEIFYVAERKNLSFHVIQCSGGKSAQAASLKTRYDTLVQILKENKTKVCIIYRTTVSGVNELYNALKKNRFLKDKVLKYHGDMTKDEKRESKELFLNSYDINTDDTRRCHTSKQCKNILIATNAFGLGIDKEDISLVIHYDIPRSLEDYYQEAGRAGRDTEKIPQADCYLLYADGPLYEKGTLRHTINWVILDREYPTSGFGSISSQFSAEMTENIFFWSYYRLCYIRKYCNEVKSCPQKFIIEYLNYEFPTDQGNMDQIAAEIDSFYNYIRDYMIPDKVHFKEEDIFKGSDAIRFLDSYFGEGRQTPGQLHMELKELIDSINEIYINNTNAANLLRDHPGKYQLNCPFEPGNKTGSEQITIYGNEKVSYFDMCVLDAIYTIEAAQKKQIHIKTIWEILNGRNQKYSSAQKHKFEAKIQYSIDKMRNMYISITDKQIHFGKMHEVFLPLKKPKGQKGYSYSVLPPLFEFAEKKNNQIIRIPVSLLNTAKIMKSDLWKTDFSVGFTYNKEIEAAFGHDKSQTFGQRVKCLSQHIKYEPELKEFIGEKYQSLELIRKNVYSFTPTIDNALLCHYLARRIAISKNTHLKRINFTRIKEITHICEDSCLFQKKAVAILDYYQKVGFLDKYYLYKLLAGDGQGLTGKAYFQVEADNVIKYWHLHDIYHLFLSDFKMTVTKKFSGNKEYTEDTMRKLAVLPFGCLDGIYLNS